MGIRAKTGQHRCSICRLHRPLCVCADLPLLDLQTKIHIVMHTRESYKTTNTGLLALKCLKNSALTLYGGQTSDRLDMTQFTSDKTALLFPGPGAQHLSAEFETIIVPDGNWRQAAKVARRIQQETGCAMVCLPAGEPSRYRLRVPPKPEMVCTFESISRALGELHGPDVRTQLDEVFFVVADRLSWVKGRLPDGQVFGGIPAGVTRANLIH
ncbi:MAG: DTW domain-containing protein [Acidobacteria bacterium]|nr:DTW domain-containing protein [Acidobacteriota bacterium]